MARVAVYHGVNATIFRAKRHFLRSRGNVRFVFEKVIMQGVRYCGDWMTTAPCDYASSDTDAPFLSNRIVNRTQKLFFRIDPYPYHYFVV